jgi:hypothetical protein
VHRNFIKAKSPEWDGKIEAYHRSLERWFVKELRAQEVVDLDHLQQLLDAMLALVYDRHDHRVTGMPPGQRLAGRCSGRQVSQADVERAFYVETTATSCKKTGEVRLPIGRFRVPSTAFAGQRCRFRHHPFHEGRAVLVTADGREIELRPFVVKPLSAVKTRTERRGTGQLQKLVDLWQGHERPNAQPGFGLPEVFIALGQLVGRDVPGSEREARSVLAFYRNHGPLPRAGFEVACERSRSRLGAGRPLDAYLADLGRQIDADRQTPDPDSDLETP